MRILLPTAVFAIAVIGSTAALPAPINGASIGDAARAIQLTECAAGVVSACVQPY